MASDDIQKTPVIEAPVIDGPARPSTRPLTGERALELRLRQQEILAKLGVLALQGTTLNQLLDRAAYLTAEGLEAEFCKVMEYRPQDKSFLVHAGVGWDPGIVGHATVGADRESPAGYALHTGRPVISNQLENEQRFRTPHLLRRHGIRRAINVILQGDRMAYGVLEVDSRSPGEFSENDIAFLQGAANILGMAIERQRIERDLLAAAETQRLLFDELNHRVKNSLQLAAATLQLQASGADDAGLRRALEEASSRIVTIGQAHEGLYRGGNLASIDLGRYLTEVCQAAQSASSPCEVAVAAPVGLAIETDRAIPIALIVNELITNAIKYAYRDSQRCRIEVTMRDDGQGTIQLSVRDEGVGLPAAFDPARSKGLGMRMVRAFARQLDAELAIHRREPGTEFELRIPLQPAG